MGYLPAGLCSLPLHTPGNFCPAMRAPRGPSAPASATGAGARPAPDHPRPAVPAAPGQAAAVAAHFICRHCPAGCSSAPGPAPTAPFRSSPAPCRCRRRGQRRPGRGAALAEGLLPGEVFYRGTPAAASSRNRGRGTRLRAASPGAPRAGLRGLQARQAAAGSSGRGGCHRASLADIHL